MSPRWTLDRATVALVGIVLVGAALRFVGLAWGLPHELHPDEWVIVTGALDLAKRNSFEPSLFMRPDHVEIQLSYLAYKAYSLLIAHSPVDVAYAADPGTFLLISRSITALFGTGMIVLAYFIGKRIAPRVGVIAAAIFAIFPAFVVHSHYATPDVPMTFFIMVLVLALVRYLSAPGYASLLVASAATSFSIAIKYPGALASVMIATVVIIAAVRDRRYKRIVSHGATAVVAVVGILFLISPVLFTNIRGVVAAIREESRMTHPGADGLGWGGNLWFYATEFAVIAGILLVVAAIAGVAFAISHRMLQVIPLALGGVFWVALSVLPLHWERWGVPMYTATLLFAAIGINFGTEALVRRSLLGRATLPALIAVYALIAANLLVGSVGVVVRLLAPDTRIALQQEFDELGITERNSIYEGYSPFSPGTGKFIFGDFTSADGTGVPLDPELKYVVLSSCSYERFLDDDKYQDEQAFYAAIRGFDRVLSVEFVQPTDRSPIELVSIVRGIGTIGEFAADGMGGCDISVYRIPGSAE